MSFLFGNAVLTVLQVDYCTGLLDGIRRHVQQDLASPQDLHQQEDSTHGKCFCMTTTIAITALQRAA